MAALAAHVAGGLAGEGREQHFAVDPLGEVLGERRLAGAGKAEQAKDRCPPAAGLEPFRGRLERGILVRCEDGHERRSGESENGIVSAAALAGKRAKGLPGSNTDERGSAAHPMRYNELKERSMNEDVFNGSIRKFLKTLGVSAQREIEKAVREAVVQG